MAALMNVARFVATSASLLALATFCVGCGGGETGPELFTVAGEVKFDGQPLQEGRILFRRTDGDQKAYAGEITNGAYEVTAEPGPMKVEIVASRLIPGKFDNSNGTPEPVGEMYIPKQYNAETTLTANVSPSGENQFPFELKSN
jgi:hypothetical protein